MSTINIVFQASIVAPCPETALFSHEMDFDHVIRWAANLDPAIVCLDQD
ncbi:hypothetical protein [Nitrosomonas sp. HPC101]|nr:hypothetical protein [Nitrosomonas sp. HPC101]